MVRLRRVLVVAAVLALTAGASPAMAKIDVLQTALRALRVAERADKAATKARKTRVDSTRLVDGSVTTDDLADGAVTVGKLAAGAVGAAALAEGSITTEKLAGDAVTGAKVADGSLALADYAALTGTATLDLTGGAGLPSGCSDQGVAAPGVKTGDRVILNAGAGLPAEIFLTPVVQPADDVLTVRVCNLGAPVNASYALAYVMIR